MEEIIKTVVKKDYNKLEYLLKLDTYTPNDYSILLHVLFYMHINDYISDHQIFYIFYLVIDRKIKFNDIEYLFEHYDCLDKKKNNLIKKFIKIKKDIILIDSGINDIITKLKTTTGNKNFSMLNNDNFYDYVFGELSKIINSFADTSFLNAIQMYNQKQKDMWVAIHEHEIRERLILLVKLFGCNIVSFMGVSVIQNSVFECMTFNEKVLYYKNCSMKLKVSIETMKDIAKRRRKLQEDNNAFEIQYNNIKHALVINDDKSDFDNMMTSLIDKYLN